LQFCSFGAGITGEKTGLIFNNGMDDFSYPGRDLNYFGLKETATNYPEAGKRALSSISPVIVIDKKTSQPKIIIGAAGGSKIISALSLAILRFLCCSSNLKEIVDAPRFHHQLVPNVLEYEYGIVNSVIEGLMLKGHASYRYRNRGTIINALTLDDRNVYAISDYRKDHSGVAGF
jgi:gamma-glutamyltranspeptidase/glutathione hydrolase/leukotriene-C4 hydrolase